MKWSTKWQSRRFCHQIPSDLAIEELVSKFCIQDTVEEFVYHGICPLSLGWTLSLGKVADDSKALLPPFSSSLKTWSVPAASSSALLVKMNMRVYSCNKGKNIIMFSPLLGSRSPLECPWENCLKIRKAEGKKRHLLTAVGRRTARMVRMNLVTLRQIAPKGHLPPSKRIPLLLTPLRHLRPKLKGKNH
uniref:Uncharacterized protein n=1 Tax=Oryza punctata TaxID=4537 RepID=A0A0E0M627_ORYPU